MTHPARPKTRRDLARPTVAVAVAGVALALAAGGASAATTASLTLQSMEPSYGPVSVRTTAGGRVTARLGWFRLGVTTATTPTATVRGFCDDPEVSITAGRLYTVQLRDSSDAPDLGTPGYHGVSWLLRSADRLIASAPNPGLEAAAIQVAVWKLGGRVPAGAATGDAALDARVAALRAESAGAGAPLPETLQARGEAVACAGDGSVRVDLSGAPGAVATITVDGPATLNTQRVVLDAAGTGYVVVRSGTPGSATVRASIQAGRLVRAARTGTGGPQETVFVTPGDVELAVPVEFRDCTSTPGVVPEEPTPGPTPPVTPTVPGDPVTPAAPGPAPTPSDAGSAPLQTPAPEVPAKAPETPVTPARPTPPRSSQRAPRLVVRKSAPARIGLGGRITYTITVRNTGPGTATGVRVTDPVPEDTFLTATPRGATLDRGAVVWSVGRLAPRRQRVIHLTVSVPTDRTGRVCNVVRVDADGGLRASARVCTRVTGRPRAVVPSVTA